LIKNFLYSHHNSDIFDEFPVLLETVILDENKSKERMNLDHIRLFFEMGA